MQAKARRFARARLGDNGEWDTPQGRWLAGVFEVESGAERALYFLPFAIAYEDTDESRWQKLQAGAIARVRRQATVGVLADATADENFCRSVVEGIGTGAEIRTQRGVVRLAATSDVRTPARRPERAAEHHAHGRSEQQHHGPCRATCSS